MILLKQRTEVECRDNQKQTRRVVSSPFFKIVTESDRVEFCSLISSQNKNTLSLKCITTIGILLQFRPICPPFIIIRKIISLDLRNSELILTTIETCSQPNCGEKHLSPIQTRFGINNNIWLRFN